MLIQTFEDLNTNKEIFHDKQEKVIEKKMDDIDSQIKAAKQNVDNIDRTIKSLTKEIGKIEDNIELEIKEIMEECAIVMENILFEYESAHYKYLQKRFEKALEE